MLRVLYGPETMFRMMLSPSAEPLKEESELLPDLNEKVLVISKTIATPSLLLQQAAVLAVSPGVLKANLLNVRLHACIP